MKHLLAFTLLFTPAMAFSEQCGGYLDLDDQRIEVSSDICETEALSVYRKLISGDFKVSEKAHLRPNDLADILFIHSQNRSDFDRCQFKGYLVTTNVVLKRKGNEIVGSSSTAICVRKTSRGNLRITHVFHDPHFNPFPQVHFGEP